MTMSAEASWGSNSHQVVASAEELDALLDRLDAEARRSGRPQDVQLTVPGGAGTLGVVVGHHRSVLNHIPADNNPPYLTTVGDENEDRPFTFYVAGDHHSEAHWRHTIPVVQARQAARAFLVSGTLDARLRWDEV